TKSGSLGKAKINASFTNGFSSIGKYLETLNSQDYANFSNEAYANRKLTTGVPFTPEEIPNLPYYDAQRSITQTGQTRDLNLSVSGGDTKSKYYLSGQYFSQGGVIRNTKLNRYNFKVNYQNNITNKLDLNINLNLSRTAANGNVANSFAGGYLNSAVVWSPTSPLVNPDGTYNVIRTYQYGTTNVIDPNAGSIYYNPRFPLTEVLGLIDLGFNNPLAFVNAITNDNTSTQVLGNLTLNYNINKNLKWSNVLGVTTYNTLLENYIPTTVPRSYALRGVATLGNQQSEKTLLQSTLSFNKVIKKHNINGVVGVTAEDYTSKTQNSSTQSFTTDITGVNAIQSGAVVQTPTSDVSNFTLLSTLARLNYHYNYKYYVTLSARYDGSSKFAEGNKFGFFPSLGLSWRVTKEKWFKIPAINEFKLRASIGEVGNQAIGPYNTLSTLSYAGVVFGGAVNTGYVPSRIANPDLFWERTKQINAGVDISLFKDRIMFTADAYQRKTSKLLYQITLPGTAGFSNLLQNIATLNNQGVDLTLSTVNIVKKDFKWTTDFNISFNRNEITKLSGKENEFLAVQQLNGTASFLSRIQAGGPVGRFYGYKTIGVWNDQTILTKPNTFQTGVIEGDRRFEDVNNDGFLNDLDRSYIGSALPKYYGGFNTSLTYKNFSLSTYFSYSVGNQVFNQLSWNLNSTGGYTNILKSVYDQRYIPITATTDPARVEAIRANNLITKVTAPGSRQSAAEVTDYYVEDGSYLRCKDITLSYSLSENLLKRLKVTNLSIFANLQNPFTITGYSGYNPEVNTGSGLTRGLDNGAYPLSKTIRFGLNVGF
ncbi:MAG: SusC/RagA family TonB-linked outer membrane protein, partial [Flavobacteriales bacterium]